MSEPILYILMRDDMVSMNAGKAMAQAAHASNQFVFEVNEATKTNKKAPILSFMHEWEKSTNKGFGTTIVLAADEAQILSIITPLKGVFADLAAGFVFDPSYPLKDGKAKHHVNVMTCAYVFFTDKSKASLNGIDKLKLHP